MPYKISTCHYATAADAPVDHHKRLNIHPWPKSKNPSPYEIFNIQEKDKNMSTAEMKKLLKRTYLSYVKIYHPDTSLVVHHKGKELSQEEKRRRFDLVQKAYNILKNPRRRLAYDRYQTTSWDDQTSMPNPAHGFSKEHFEAYRRANAHRAKYSFDRDEAFWHAGTWDDYYRAKYNRAPPTMEEIEKNKYKILWGVLLVGAISFGLQISRAIDTGNEYLLSKHKQNLKSIRDLNDSYGNYGEGDKEADRVKRFIASRRANLMGKFDAEKSQFATSQEEDRHALVQYARTRVRQWEEGEQFEQQMLPMGQVTELTSK